MTFEIISKKEKEFDGKVITRTDCAVGNYAVIVYDSLYSDGTVRRDVECRRLQRGPSYIPDIYYQSGWAGEEAEGFSIQTTSYGALDVAEFQKFLAAQQEALEVVEILNREFGREGDLAK